MLTDKEKKVIDKMKSTPWGTIVIKMKGGKPVMLSATEDIKLDQEVLTMAGCKGKGMKGMGKGMSMPKSEKKEMGKGMGYGKKK